jgi:hypothetical protein
VFIRRKLKSFFMKLKVKPKILLPFLLSLSAFAGTITSPEQFFYQKGYNEGFARGKQLGYMEGYKQAMKDVKKILEVYKKDLQALEAGKYLVEEDRITYPRIVKIPKPDGGFEIKIIGCRIEDLRNLDDITKLAVNIPVITEREIKEANEAKQRLISIPKLSEEALAAYKKPPQPIVVPVDKSKRELLDKLNIPYEIDAKGNIRAIFFSERDYELFKKMSK